MKRRGFTLIELLIVVAIIAILAAIAVPNFLTAQTRSKLARAYADMRSLSTAVEAYQVDWNRYPPDSGPGFPDQPCFPCATSVGNLSGFWTLAVITTPVSYITSLPNDPFMPPDYPDRFSLNDYTSFHYGAETSFRPSDEFKYFLGSLGPDLSFGDGVYDPTNGVVSDGDIYTWGPGNVRKTGF